MTDNVENLVLEHLRALRAGQDRIELKLSELSSRITSLETTTTRGAGGQPINTGRRIPATSHAGPL